MKLGCGCAIVNNEKKVLLGLRCKKTDLPQWSFAGGGVEDNETPIQAVAREIKEETNLEPLNLLFIGNFVFNNVDDYIFMCDSFAGELKPNENEFKELRWFSFEELEKIELFPYTEMAIKLLKKYEIIL